MNLQEAGKILGIASSFDRFIELGQLNTTVWHKVLEEHDYATASEATIGWYIDDWDGKTQLHPSALIGRINRLTRAHENQARVAAALDSLPRLRQELATLEADPATELRTIQEARIAVDHAEMITQTADDGRRVISGRGRQHVSPQDEWKLNR